MYNEYKMHDVGIFPMVGDLLHVGHITALAEAKRHCNFLIVALNCNPCDNKAKHKPVESVYERYRRISSLACVDCVIPYEGEADLELLLQTTHYDVRFVGEDHKKTLWTGYSYEQKHGIAHEYISREHNVSSTELKQRIVDDNKARAKCVNDAIKSNRVG